MRSLRASGRYIPIRPSLFSNSIWNVGGLWALDFDPTLRELGKVAICNDLFDAFSLDTMRVPLVALVVVARGLVALAIVVEA